MAAQEVVRTRLERNQRIRFTLCCMQRRSCPATQTSPSPACTSKGFPPGVGDTPHFPRRSAGLGLGHVNRNHPDHPGRRPIARRRRLLLFPASVGPGGSPPQPHERRRLGTLSKVPIMTPKTRNRKPPESAKNIQPLDPREYPLARDSRGTAAREEIRCQSPMVSAPRQSQRPVERGNESRPHARGQGRGTRVS